MVRFCLTVPSSSPACSSVRQSSWSPCERVVADTRRLPNRWVSNSSCWDGTAWMHWSPILRGGSSDIACRPPISGSTSTTTGLRKRVGSAMHPPLRDILPHAGSMILLAAILEHSQESTTCLVTVGEHDVFAAADGAVPAWIGLEYIAQCIAAHGGLHARSLGEEIRIGFLLGSRRLEVRASEFRPGQRLAVRVEHV